MKERKESRGTSRWQREKQQRRGGKERRREQEHTRRKSLTKKEERRRDGETARENRTLKIKEKTPRTTLHTSRGRLQARNKAIA